MFVGIVGTLEQLETFYRVLLHRTEYTRMSLTSIPMAAAVTRNITHIRHSLASKYSGEVVDNASNRHRQAGISTEQEKIALHALSENPNMQCASYLWRVASETTRADDACFSLGV